MVNRNALGNKKEGSWNVDARATDFGSRPMNVQQTGLCRVLTVGPAREQKGKVEGSPRTPPVRRGAEGLPSVSLLNMLFP